MIQDSGAVRPDPGPVVGGAPPFYRCTDHPGSALEMVGHWLSIKLAAAGALAKAL
jgi:hypothetical protein